MSGNDSKNERGGRKSEPAGGVDPSQEFSQEAAKNKKPPVGVGLTEPVDETDEKARHSEGRKLPKQATPSPDSEKLGAGPAIAEHSKDAKALKGGRKAGAYVKR